MRVTTKIHTLNHIDSFLRKITPTKITYKQLPLASRRRIVGSMSVAFTFTSGGQGAIE